MESMNMIYMIQDKFMITGHWKKSHCVTSRFQDPWNIFHENYCICKTVTNRIIITLKSQLHVHWGKHVLWPQNSFIHDSEHPPPTHYNLFLLYPSPTLRNHSAPYNFAYRHLDTGSEIKTGQYITCNQYPDKNYFSKYNKNMQFFFFTI